MNKRQKIKRQFRVRSKIKGTKEKPRLSVFRSNRYLYVQLIDDEKQKTILSFSEKHLLDKTKSEIAGRKDQAKQLGLLLAKRALDKKITRVVFDRGSYAYHGKVKAIAEGARAGGLQL